MYLPYVRYYNKKIARQHYCDGGILLHNCDHQHRTWQCANTSCRFCQRPCACVKAPAAATDTTARLETRENMNKYTVRVVEEYADTLGALNTQDNKSSRKQPTRFGVSTPSCRTGPTSNLAPRDPEIDLSFQISNKYEDTRTPCRNNMQTVRYSLQVHYYNTR